MGLGIYCLQGVVIANLRGSGRLKGSYPILPHPSAAPLRLPFCLLFWGTVLGVMMVGLAVGFYNRNAH